jgi:hypothetical protein
VGFDSPKNHKPPAGAAEIRPFKPFFRPVPGLGRFAVGDPRFHRGLLSFAAPQLPMDFENSSKMLKRFLAFVSPPGLF